MSVLAVGIGLLAAGRWMKSLHSAARWGLGGAFGLAIVGTLTLFIGQMSLRYMGSFQIVWALVGVYGLFRFRQELKPSGDVIGVALSVLIGLLFLLRVPAVMSPSLGADWDTTSHQVAMAKIWLMHEKFDAINFMDHSNIPATVNAVYINGFSIGGQTGAKTFAFCFAVFAVLSVAGLTAMKFGKNAAWLSGFAFLVIPVVFWEPGTGYVDVAHGLFCGSAILFAAMWLSEKRKEFLILSAICLGFAMATKYTGLQIGFALGVGLVFVGILRKESKRAFVGALTIGGIAIVIASPWFVRNVVNTGNPLYPFFYSVFGGRNWNTESAEAYSAEQKRFGIGQTETGKNLVALPGSVTALALQPDAQINNGAIWGAMGPLFVFGLLIWLFSGKMGDQEKVIVATCLVMLLTWFFLTQQSRYIISLMFPVAFLLGGALTKLRLGWLGIVGTVLQGAYTVFIFVVPSDIGGQINDVISGKSEMEMLKSTVQVDNPPRLEPRFPFAEGTEAINNLGDGSSDVVVALFDEVRGLYLNRKYFWANPGHHTLIPYDEIHDGAGLIAALKKLGTTHVYVNMDPALVGKSSMEMRNVIFIDKEFPTPDLVGYGAYLIDAYKSGLMRLVVGCDQPKMLGGQTPPPPRAALFEIVQDK